MLIGEQRRGTWRCRPPGLFLWMIIPEAAEQIMKDLAGKDLKRGRCRFTCESWCEAGSSVQGVFEMGWVRVERYRMLRLAMAACAHPRAGMWLSAGSPEGMQLWRCLVRRPELQAGRTRTGYAREAWLWLGSGLRLLRHGLVRMFFPHETHGVVFRVLSQSCFSLACAEQLRSPCWDASVPILSSWLLQCPCCAHGNKYQKSPWPCQGITAARTSLRRAV